MTYTSDKTVKTTAMLDWSRGLDSSLVVNTPFSGWEQSSATLRHEGEWNDFSSLADVTVGGQSVTGNLKLLHKMKTDAQLSLTTPWAGWEKVRHLDHTTTVVVDLCGHHHCSCGFMLTPAL